MGDFSKFRRVVAAVLTVSMIFASVPVVPASAALVGTDRIIVQEQGADQRAKVEAFLEREDVQAQLVAMGIGPEEAKTRVAALSDEEVAQIAGKIDEMPAGEGVFTSILIAIAVVVIVLVITDLVGLTAVFPFTKKGALRP